MRRRNVARQISPFCSPHLTSAESMAAEHNGGSGRGGIDGWTCDRPDSSPGMRPAATA
jgi:hypothetical protein